MLELVIVCSSEKNKINLVVRIVRVLFLKLPISDLSSSDTNSEGRPKHNIGIVFIVA
jgi:hypothetical protein